MKILTFSLILFTPKGFTIYLIMFLNNLGGTGRNMISNFTENMLYAESIKNTIFQINC
jgi:hypothetical protein